MKSFSLPPVAIVRRQALACGLLRVLVAVLTLALVGNSIAYAQGPATPNATKQELLQQGISKHIKVKEVDGTTVKGTLTAVNDDSFQIIPKDGGPPLSIAFSQVVKVTRTGMPTAVKAVLWTVTGVIVAAIITLIVLHAKGGIF
jgi:hypothetical protein